MRRDRLAPLAVVAGLALAGLSAVSWPDSTASTTATPPPTSSAPSNVPGSSTPSSRTPNTAGTLRPSPLEPQPTALGKGSGHPTKPPVAIVRAGSPERLDLPSIGVSALVFPIGLDGSLTLTPPSDYTTVGWWSQGAQPGEGHGTTILAGHTVHTGGGALDHLGDVKVGDSITLERATQDLRYEVTSVTTYRKGTLATRAAQVFKQTGPERLAVVTCGDWNGEIYLSNVVVIATNPHPVSAVS